MSVRLSVHLSESNNSDPAGRIFMLFDIWAFFKSAEKFHISLKSGNTDDDVNNNNNNNNSYFMWSLMYIYDISLNSC